MKNINSAIVIPALNPIPELFHYVMELLKHGVPQIIVVNDGSDSYFDPIFEEIDKLENCTVLTHRVNQGKGRALKTAFSYFIKHHPDLDGVVTADADGQHAVEDVLRICERLSLKEGSLVLGVRNFKEQNVPRRSYLGNSITSFAFQLLYGSRLKDTQTGLRGIPSSELPWMTQMKGERYDYEINMLIKARHRNIALVTLPIKTLYFNNNSGSHYKAIRDSARIFVFLISGLLQFSMATIASGIIDITGFFLMNTFIFTNLSAPVRLLTSTVLARLLSSICNYSMNRNIIFSDKGSLTSSALRYYILCISQMMASYGFVYTISLFWGINESIIKLFVDIVLGLFSYQLQMRWVFRYKAGAETSSVKA